jgi:YesN/AraC family two-component response regulator
MSYNLLLVDDDGEFRREIRECFDDFVVTEAADGETAVKMLKKPNTIDLVLLDQNMPGLKGTDVLAEIKKINPLIKVVMLTGNSSKDTAITALKNRADEYIEKPMDIAEGREIILKLLGEKDSGRILDNGSMKAKIEKVKVFVERNFDKKVSLEDAASHAGISPKYLSRAFEEHAGVGFAAYKTSVRLEKAKAFLKQGYNINQISGMLAYENTESFIRAFKKVMGFPPLKFREKKLAIDRSKKKAKRGKNAGRKKQVS